MSEVEKKIEQVSELETKELKPKVSYNKKEIESNLTDREKIGLKNHLKFVSREYWRKGEDDVEYKLMIFYNTCSQNLRIATLKVLQKYFTRIEKQSEDTYFLYK